MTSITFNGYTSPLRSQPSAEQAQNRPQVAFGKTHGLQPQKLFNVRANDGTIYQQDNPFKVATTFSKHRLDALA